MTESPASSKRLAGRVALITGASRGIGAAVAKAFAAEGAHLILAARTVGGLEDVDDAIRAAYGEDARPTLLPLDLSEPEQIDVVAPSIAQRFGRLDVFVGNAGSLGTLTPMSHIDPETWDEVIAVNLTANWRLIRGLEPLLRISDAGRAIFVTSGIAHKARPFWGAYAVSKAAVEMMARVWAAELEKTKIRVNLVDPGATHTKLRSAAYPGEDPTTLKEPEAVAPVFVDLADAACTKTGEVVRCY